MTLLGTRGKCCFSNSAPLGEWGEIKFNSELQRGAPEDAGYISGLIFSCCTEKGATGRTGFPTTRKLQLLSCCSDVALEWPLGSALKYKVKHETHFLASAMLAQHDWMRRPRLDASRSRPFLKREARIMLVPPLHHHALPCRYQFSSHGSDYRRICKVNLMVNPCHRSFNGAQVRPMGSAFPKPVIGDSSTPSSGPYGRLLAAACWLETSNSRMCCMEN